MQAHCVLAGHTRHSNTGIQHRRHKRNQPEYCRHAASRAPCLWAKRTQQSNAGKANNSSQRAPFSSASFGKFHEWHRYMVEHGLTGCIMRHRFACTYRTRALHAANKLCTGHRTVAPHTQTRAMLTDTQKFWPKLLFHTSNSATSHKPKVLLPPLAVNHYSTTAACTPTHQ